VVEQRLVRDARGVQQQQLLDHLPRQSIYPSIDRSLGRSR
jgi:hypothetical protein